MTAAALAFGAAGCYGELAPKRASVDEVLPHLPARNVGRFGRPGDPLSMVFVGTKEQVVGALERGGWKRISTYTLLALGQAASDLFTRGTILRWPMNNYGNFGRDQDLNFAIATRHIVSRHHFRLWRTPFEDPSGRPIWWGSGNYDVSIRFHDLSHRPDPDTDMEREYIAKTLEGKARLRYVPLPQIPKEGFNDKGYPFTTDGRALVAEFD